jgi:type II secretory pathway pseudopilin PulG
MRSKGYSLIEVVGVLVLLIILMGIGIWSFGNNADAAKFGQISSDLKRISSGKTLWRTEHPTDAFPGDDADRFVVLQPYLKAGLLQVTSLTTWAPSGVTYQINAENTAPTALNTATAKYYDPVNNDWMP